MNGTSNEQLQQRIEDLDRKMDRVLEELEEQRRNRMALADLEEDLVRVGNDAFRSIMADMDVYEDTINRQEFWKLFLNLARNVHYMNEVVLKMESGMSFLEDASPIGRELIMDFTKQLSVWQEKGYFEMFKVLTKQVDRVAGLVQPDDVRTAGDEIERLMKAMRETPVPADGDISLFKLLREMNTPETKQALGMLFAFLKTWMRQPAPAKELKTTSENAYTK